MPANTTPTEADPIRLDFARLRRQRRLMEISQKRLSKLAGVHDNAVMYWENGKRRPGLADIIQTARVLGTPVLDLFDVYDQTDNPVDFRRKPR
jgi:transcriptional regulator with XRE-family HTH domain